MYMGTEEKMKQQEKKFEDKVASLSAELKKEVDRSGHLNLRIEQEAHMRSKTKDELIRKEEEHSHSRSVSLAQINKLEEQIEVVRKELGVVESRANELSQANAYAEGLLAGAEKRAEEMAQTNESLTKRLEELTQTSEGLVKRVDELEEENQQLQEERDEATVDTSKDFLFTFWKRHPNLDFSFFGQNALEAIARFTKKPSTEEGEAKKARTEQKNLKYPSWC